MNFKHLLSGLEPDQLEHPTVKRVVSLLLERCYTTGQGLTVIRWYEESYNQKLIA